jgi:hypothetical protein
VLEALLAVDFQDVEALRRQVAEVAVVAMCGCGCPSIDFQRDRGFGMRIRVNAAIPDSYDSLFLYTIEDPQRGELLGGVEWVSIEETSPDEFPPPDLLNVQPA